MIKIRTDFGLDVLAVKIRQAAPVQRGPQMMRGVKTIIEKQPVDDTPRDVPRMVVNRTVVAILVLEQVDSHDSPLPE